MKRERKNPYYVVIGMDPLLSSIKVYAALTLVAEAVKCHRNSLSGINNTMERKIINGYLIIPTYPDKITR